MCIADGHGHSHTRKIALWDLTISSAGRVPLSAGIGSHPDVSVKKSDKKRRTKAVQHSEKTVWSIHALANEETEHIRVLLDLMQQNIALNYPSSSISSSAAPSPTIPATSSTTAPSRPADQSVESEPNVHASVLDWGESLPPHIDAEGLDMVLAADCVYFEVRLSSSVLPFLGRGGAQSSGSGDDAGV